MTETIRVATISDAAAVTALTTRAYAKWVPVIGREPLPMKADHAAFILEHRVDLLFVGPNLAALIETIGREEDILIENVAVDPGHQKRGYGRKMIALAEQMAVRADLVRSGSIRTPCSTRMFVFTHRWDTMSSARRR